jgi:Zn-dependent protease
MSSAPFASAAFCPDCGFSVDPSSLSCSNCGWLRHASRLEELAGRAATAESAGDLTAARSLWEEALSLLPRNTVQFKTIEAKVAAIAQRMELAQRQNAGWKRGAAGGIGSALLLLLGKWKLLLLGLTKMSTLLSMFAFFGVYWSVYGWVFALGFVLAIYVHEMGHVIMLRRYGIPATAPLFIPGLGAMIGVPGAIVDPIQDARVGLAGPIYGLGAGIVLFAARMLTGWGALGAIAHATATINLFNLTPVWQLDGSRGLHSLTRRQRAILLAICIGMLVITWEKMLLLVGAVLAYRLFTKDQALEPDETGFRQFAFLLVALAGLGLVSRDAGIIY